MAVDFSTNPTSESVEAFVTEIARQRAELNQSRSFPAIRAAARGLGLHRIAPEQVVVGGTNGKGSTVRYLQQILTHQGIRVGTTTSPHMHRYLERITLDNEQVTASQCFDAISTVADVTGGLALTYFDLTSLAALYLFKQWEVDVALVEVGLGGRLDCANVVDSDVAVITNIDIDHGAVLGNTIDEISREKVPIARPDKPLVFSDLRENSVVRQYALKHRSPLFQIDREFGLTNAGTVFVTRNDERCTFPVPLSINYAVESFSAALQVAVLLDDVPSEEELGKVRFSLPEGRLERLFARDRHWILDVAHNPAAIRFLRQQLARQNISQCVVVFTCFTDKDVEGMLKSLVETDKDDSVEVTDVVLTDSYGVRSITATSLADRSLILDREFNIQSNLNDALATAVSLSTQDAPIVVLGSFDVVSRARSALNVCDVDNCDR